MKHEIDLVSENMIWVLYKNNIIDICFYKYSLIFYVIFVNLTLRKSTKTLIKKWIKENLN